MQFHPLHHVWFSRASPPFVSSGIPNLPQLRFAPLRADWVIPLRFPLRLILSENQSAPVTLSPPVIISSAPLPRRFSSFLAGWASRVTALSKWRYLNNPITEENMTNNLKNQLKQFTGSEQIFYNPLFPKFRYTEGVKYLAQAANCYWLLDYIFSSQHLKTLQQCPFQVWKLKVTENQAAKLFVEDGNSNLVKSFNLKYTDFPLEQIDLWLVDNILLLPSEY